MKKYILLFLTAMLQVSFVSMNVVFISRSMIVPMLVTGFLISFIWTLNVKRVAFGGYKDRLIYACGACCGTGLGYIIAKSYIFLYCVQ